MTDSRHSDQIHFCTTQWTLVMGAAASSVSVRQAALEKLCGRYWLPLYAFLRRRGQAEHEAEDLVQGFFAQLLEKDYLNAIDASKGRFRSFMLVALQHFAANERAKAKTVKRGGAVTTLPIDFSIGERWYRHEPTDGMTAEMLFERRWALSLLDNVMQRLKQRLSEQNRVELFEILKPHLVRDAQKLPYAEIAQRLECSVASIKSTMHRMKGWYRELLLDEISQTVAQQDVADELRRLMAIVSEKS
ncbi:MAG: hypothetical protein R3C53_21065 [Pirellulaceae bacterium]